VSPWLPSWPDDGPRWLSLVFAAALVGVAPRALRGKPAAALWVAAPLAAAALSAAYVLFYLRGGARIIDATAYWLEARTFASGSLTLPMVGPEASVMGRFVLRAPEGAAVIFPPGYPAVLALGFAIGAPLAIGPLLAACITLATMDLTRWLAPASLRGPAVTLAALVSVVCATLRYHTADTMAHGLAALCVTIAAAAALRARPHGGRPSAVALGAALGLLFATRPVSALAALVLLPLARRRLGLVALAAIPGVLGWGIYQHAATGSPWLTAQQIYYALSDGPEGCFRYGFGGVGCLGEHGEFIRSRMPDGFGPLEVLATTGRRLALHASDALGFAPAFALVLLGMRRAGAVGLFPLALTLAYAPFYFDGNYLGGGARMLAEALPIEHALAGLGLATLGDDPRRFARRATAVVVASLVGFSFHLGAHHRHLRDREGGRPMFEAGRVPPGMVFVDTDHGFNLAFDPSLVRPGARHRGDVTDRLAWRAHGSPPAWRYQHDWEGGPPIVTPMRFVDDRLEGESLWPARSQDGAWAWPVWEAGDCASGGRALRVAPSPAGRVVVGLPAELVGSTLVPRVRYEKDYKNAHLADAAELTLRADGEVVGRWSVAAAPGCQSLAPVALPEARSHELEIRVAAPLLLDALLVRLTR
jgi:hypothetical protein